MSKYLLIASMLIFSSIYLTGQETGSFQIDVDFNEADYDFDRTLYYYVPTDYDATKSYPLVVGFRGGPHSSAGQFRNQLTFMADSIGAIILCPENAAHFWNNEGLTKQLFKYSVEYTENIYSIDPNFIYLTGLSYGGRHAVIVAMDTDDGEIPQLRGVIPFAAGSEADLQPNYENIEDFAPACICIGLSDSQNFITVSNNLVDDITFYDGDAILNGVPNVGHTVAFSGYAEEMMECINYIESQTLISSTNDLDSTKNTKIYPNPSEQVINIEIEQEAIPSKIYLSKLNGEVVKEIPSNIRTLSVSDIPKGAYLLTIEFESGKESQKVIVE